MYHKRCRQRYLWIERNIREAIELHLEGLREDGEPIPEPQTAVTYLELQGIS
jgi:hypothetical protein